MLYVLGLHAPGGGGCHDAGFCLAASDGTLIKHCEIERVVRVKHTGKLVFPQFNPLALVKQIVGDQPVVIYYTETHKDTKCFTDNTGIEITKENKYGLNIQEIVSTPHHYAHLYGALSFYPELHCRKIPFVVADGYGYDFGVRGTSLIGHVERGVVTTTSQKSDAIPTSEILERYLGPHSAGKMMGLAGYYPEVTAESLSIQRRNYFVSNSTKIAASLASNPDENILRELAALYKKEIEAIKQAIKRLCPPCTDGLLVSGGTFYSLELNAWIASALTNKLYFTPASGDSGLAIGAACYGLYKTTGILLKANSPFLNQTIKQSKLPFDATLSPKQLATMLANNKIVGLIRGDSEIGPRALGHRSILASPTFPEMFNRVSINLKQREHYRPLAPIVTDRQFDALFKGHRGAYMQYAVQCTEITQRALPAICHKDLTSRPQVITEQSDPWLYEMLIELGKLTGYECSINTSLNRQNPIAMTVDDAIDDFKSCRDQIILATSNDQSTTS